jgi:hypothetical protein
MAEGNGKILIAGLDLGEAEKAIVNNLIQSYKSKINERAGFEELKIRFKKAQKGKAWLHEIDGELRAMKKMFSAKANDYNVFIAVNDVLEKLLNSMVHSMRTPRQKK